MNNFHPKLKDTEAIFSYKVDQITLTIESLGQHFKDQNFFLLFFTIQSYLTTYFQIALK